LPRSKFCQSIAKSDAKKEIAIAIKIGAAGKADLLVYYLPIFTTLCLLMRCRQQNDRNKKKHGTAWATYCEKVPSNLIPKIY